MAPANRIRTSEGIARVETISPVPRRTQRSISKRYSHAARRSCNIQCDNKISAPHPTAPRQLHAYICITHKCGVSPVVYMDCIVSILRRCSNKLIARGIYFSSKINIVRIAAKILCDYLRHIKKTKRRAATQRDLCLILLTCA